MTYPRFAAIVLTVALDRPAAAAVQPAELKSKLLADAGAAVVLSENSRGLEMNRGVCGRGVHARVDGSLATARRSGFQFSPG